jgi:3-hydroxyisobutyrate dehydrogenase-like beta-hydroxyacid dehydrogenase
MKVGFIGLGKMGSAMARNLIKAGHALVLYNRTRSRVEELQPLGAEVAGTPGEAASGVEALITMLADDYAVEDAMLGPGQAFQSLPPGAVHIGMSTISVALSRRLAAAHRERQQHYVALRSLAGPRPLPQASSSSLPPDQSNRLSAVRCCSTPWDRRHS